MKITSSIGWEKAWLQKVVGWCCAELDYAPKNIQAAHFSLCHNASFRGVAFLEHPSIRVKINPLALYPLRSKVVGTRDLPHVVFQDPLEILIHVTAHEVAHLERWDRFARELKQRGERDTMMERETDAFARRVLDSFRRQRESLLAVWGDSGKGPCPPKNVYQLTCPRCGDVWLRTSAPRSDCICKGCFPDPVDAIIEGTFLRCERVPWSEGSTSARAAKNGVATNGEEEMLPVVKEPNLDGLAEQVKQEHAGVVDAAKKSLEHARRAGELLLQAKPLCGHSKWLPWLKQQAGISPSTASAYMRVAKHWDKLAAAANLREALKLLREDGEPSAVGGTVVSEPATEVIQPPPATAADIIIERATEVATPRAKEEIYRSWQRQQGEAAYAWLIRLQRVPDSQKRGLRNEYDALVREAELAEWKERGKPAPEAAEPPAAPSPGQQGTLFDLPVQAPGAYPDAQAISPPSGAGVAVATPEPADPLRERLAALRTSRARVDELLTPRTGAVEGEGLLDLLEAIQEEHDALSRLDADLWGVHVAEPSGRG